MLIEDEEPGLYYAEEENNVLTVETENWIFKYNMESQFFDYNEKDYDNDEMSPYEYLHQWDNYIDIALEGYSELELGID